MEIQTPAQLIVALGGVTIVSEGLNLSVGTVSAWGSRGRIPSVYWIDIVALAKKRRVRGVSHEYLSTMHARAKEAAA